MGLINCPNCGKQISDKATQCVNCNYLLSQKNTIICPDCGESLNDNTVNCPKCGCPINSNVNIINNGNQQVEATRTKVNVKKVILIICGILFLIGIIVGFIIGIKNEQIKKYKGKYEEVMYLMLDGAADAESCGNLTKSVWYNCICEVKDKETDKYTINKITGTFEDDFNIALEKLFSDNNYKKQEKSIKNNQNEVAKLMKEMKNPPSELNESYEVLKSYYDSYLTFTNCAINPTGSLTTFSDNFSSADADCVKWYDKAKNEIE